MKQLRAKRWFWVALLGVALGIIALVVLQFTGIFTPFNFSKTPVLQIETPNKMPALPDREFVLDVTLSSLGEGDILFPAASVTVEFDPNALEFLGVQEGNVMVTDPTSQQWDYTLPQWQVDVPHCNATGAIHLLYLDMTGGLHAFRYGGFIPEEQDVLVRLVFRQRGTVAPGDIYPLNITDAVLAANQEEDSLSLVAGTLQTKDARVVLSHET